jgi:isopenicillin N synthase-like dioxygenase
VRLADLDFERVVAAEPSALGGLVAALHESGFFLLRNHTVAEDLIGPFQAEADALRQLSAEAKASATLRQDFTGWVPYATGQIATSQLNPRPVPDLYEAFLIKEWMLGKASAWPPGTDSLRSLAQTYFEALRSVGTALLAPLARALGLPSGFFDPYFRDGEMTLRLNLYPEVSNVPRGAHRMAPHVDSGFLTFLPGYNLDALEVKLGGSWQPAGNHPGRLAVNAGAILERWSNGAVKASVHRVQAVRGALPRVTTPFFFSPNRDAIIEPMSNGRPPAGEPIRFGDFLEWFMRSNLPETPPMP